MSYIIESFIKDSLVVLMSEERVNGRESNNGETETRTRKWKQENIEINILKFGVKR